MGESAAIKDIRVLGLIMILGEVSLEDLKLLNDVKDELKGLNDGKDDLELLDKELYKSLDSKKLDG